MARTRVRRVRRITTRRKQRGGWPSCFGGKCSTAVVNSTAHLPPTIKNPLSSIPPGPVTYGPATVNTPNVNPIAKINSNVFAKSQIKQLLASILDKWAKLAAAPEQMKPRIMESIKAEAIRLQTHINIYIDRFSREYNYAAVSSKMTAKKYNKPEIQDLLARFATIRRTFPIQIKEKKVLTQPARNNIIGPLSSASNASKPSFNIYRHAYILESVLNILEPIMAELPMAKPVELEPVEDMPGSPANSGNEGNA